MVKIFRLLSQFITAMHDWGGGASFSFVFMSRFFPNLKGAMLNPLQARFSHRGPCDRPVLGQFFGQFGIVNTHGGKPMRTIVDAGANIGVFSAIARHLYPNAQIIALEADSGNFDILKGNAENLKNVIPVNVALWSQTGSIYLNFGAGPESHSVGEKTAETSILIPSICLEDLMNRYNLKEIDLLKMDIEGAESTVINSLNDEVLKRVNAIRFECNDSDAPGNALKLLSRLLSEDFDAYSFDENLYLIRRDTRWTFQRHYSGIGKIPRMTG